MRIDQKFQISNIQKNIIFDDIQLRRNFYPKKTGLSMKSGFLVEYLRFFSKEIIYNVFSNIFYKKVIEFQRYNLGISGLKINKNFYKALIFTLNYFHTIFKNFFSPEVLSTKKYNSLYSRHCIFKSFYVNLLRNQIVRKMSLSQSVSSICLKIFKKQIIHTKTVKFNQKSLVDFLFKRINYTKKNHTPAFIIFKMGFLAQIFDLKIIQKINFRTWLLKSISIQIIGGKKIIHFSFLMNQQKKKIPGLTYIDNLYQIVIPFLYLKNKNNNKSFNNLSRLSCFNLRSDSFFRLISTILFDSLYFNSKMESLIYKFSLKNYLFETIFFLKKIILNIYLFKKITTFYLLFNFKKQYILKKKKFSINWNIIFHFIFKKFTKKIQETIYFKKKIRENVFK